MTIDFSQFEKGVYSIDDLNKIAKLRNEFHTSIKNKDYRNARKVNNIIYEMQFDKYLKLNRDLQKIEPNSESEKERFNKLVIIKVNMFNRLENWVKEGLELSGGCVVQNHIENGGHYETA